MAGQEETRDTEKGQQLPVQPWEPGPYVAPSSYFVKMRQKSKFLCEISKFSNESPILLNCASQVEHSEG